MDGLGYSLPTFFQCKWTLDTVDYETGFTWNLHLRMGLTRMIAGQSPSVGEKESW